MRKVSEFEVQAVVYWKLKSYFNNVRGEYKIPRTATTPGCRLDICVLDEDDNILFSIEVKKNPNGRTVSQGHRYEALTGKPCFYIRGMEEAENVLEILKGRF